MSWKELLATHQDAQKIQKKLAKPKHHLPPVAFIDTPKSIILLLMTIIFCEH